MRTRPSAAVFLVVMLAAGCLPGPEDRQYACNTDAQCTTGWKCHPDEHFCRRPCDAAQDCEQGQACTGGICSVGPGTTASSSGVVVTSSSVEGSSSSGESSSSEMGSSSSGGSSSSSRGPSSSSGIVGSSSQGGSSGAPQYSVDAIGLTAGGMSNENNLFRVNLCVGQSVVGFEDADPSRVSLGILGTIAPDREGALP